MKKNKPAARKGTTTKASGRTAVPGQNPKADDSPEHDEYHDENRRNLYDPEVARGLRGAGRKSAARR